MLTADREITDKATGLHKYRSTWSNWWTRHKTIKLIFFAQNIRTTKWTYNETTQRLTILASVESMQLFIYICTMKNNKKHTLNVVRYVSARMSAIVRFLSILFYFSIHNNWAHCCSLCVYISLSLAAIVYLHFSLSIIGWFYNDVCIHLMSVCIHTSFCFQLNWNLFTVACNNSNRSGLHKI